MTRFNGARFREARMTAGISEERVASLLHPSPHTLAAYEMGDAQPSRQTVVRLAAIVGVEPTDLLDRDEAHQ